MPRVLNSRALSTSAAALAHKEVKFSNDGRAAILKGVNLLANAVSVTPVSYTHLTLPTKA